MEAANQNKENKMNTKQIEINGCRILKNGVKSPSGKYHPAWYSRFVMNLTGVECVTVYAKKYGSGLPSELGSVENNSDVRADYFEKDKCRFLVGSPEFATLATFCSAR